MSKDLLVLADQYAAATATFARALALKDEADSMSPIAREAGDKRAALAEAIAALDTAQPELEPEQLTQLARESGFYQEPDTSLMPSTAAEKWLHCKQADIVRFADAVLQQAQPSQADAQDAARYRWLRSTTNWASNSSNERINVRNCPELWDAAIDAAINAKESK